MKSIDQHFFNKKSDDVKKIFSDHTQKLSEIDKRRIEDEIFGWGPLEKIKERSDIFEIIVKGSNDIFFETAQGLERWNDHFLSDYSFYNFTEELFKKANILVSKQEPCANGFIDGFRIHVTTPPV
ncbi:MAG: hypothetical protein MJK18_07065, partial [Bdellovibrionales bacterium]|nr:hypothetical protein [Bdellovibrionales bacterium]